MTIRLMPVLVLALAFAWLLRYFVKELPAIFRGEPVQSTEARLNRAAKAYFLAHVGLLLIAVLLSVLHRTIVYQTYFAALVLSVYFVSFLLSGLLMGLGFLLYFVRSERNLHSRIAEAGVALAVVVLQVGETYTPHFLLYYCCVFYLEKIL